MLHYVKKNKKLLFIYSREVRHSRAEGWDRIEMVVFQALEFSGVDVDLIVVCNL